MEYVYLGKIVNTHGIKGEIRIISNFKYKEQAFKPNFTIYIGDKKEKYLITSYRPHKNYDMVTLAGINNINDVIKYKGYNVYINKADLTLTNDMYFDEDLIGCLVYDNDQYIGEVIDLMETPANRILVIMNNDKQILIPQVDEFIKKVDINNKKIIINSIKGMI